MGPPAWKKLLYERQPFPDSYTDSYFLGELRKNVNVKIYRYPEVLFMCNPVIQNLSVTVGFLSVFQLLSTSLISPTILISLSNGIALLLYFAWLLVSLPKPASHNISRAKPPTSMQNGTINLVSSAIENTDPSQCNILGLSESKYTLARVSKSREAKSSDSRVYLKSKLTSGDPTITPLRSPGKQLIISGLLFKLVLLGFSPVLKTLTESFSTDTIWLLTTLAFLLHALTFDYATDSPHLQDSLALNAAIFASIMLASRLPSNAHVFGLVSLAVDCFAVLPRFKKVLRASSRQWSTLIEYALTGLLVSGTSMIMSVALPPAVLVIYLLVVLGGAATLPAYFVYLQRYKNELHGPWDGASLSLPPTDQKIKAETIN